MDKQPVLGVTEAMILSAKVELGILFPEALRDTWKIYNCNEMRGAAGLERYSPRTSSDTSQKRPSSYLFFGSRL